jgi:hypothetical protein
MIVHYANRYRRPPRKKPKQPPLPIRIVTAKAPKPMKRRRLVVVSPPIMTAQKPTTEPSIVRPVTAKQRRWNAMRERMRLKP